MKQLLMNIVCIALLTTVKASPMEAEVGNDRSLEPCFVFFYSTGCPHCKAARDYIDEDLAEKSGLTFQYEAFNVHSSGRSRELLAGYERFNSSEKGVPTVFIGTEEDITVLVGENEIIHQLPSLLLRAQNETLECYDFHALSQSEDLDLSSASDIHWGVRKCE